MNLTPRTLEQIKEELALLPDEQQDELAAYLSYLRQKREPGRGADLARRIADHDPTHWVSVDQLREHWKE